jgi:TolB protein
MRTLAAALAIALLSAPPTGSQRVSEAIGGGTPAVSPDGRQIAFISDRDGTQQVYVITDNGSGLLRLTTMSGPKSPPSWSSDGQRVLFSTTAGDTAKLFSIKRDGSVLRQIAAVAGRSPVLSRDEREVLFTSGGFTRSILNISALDGADRRAISDSSAGIFNHVFSPDGGRVAYSRLDQSHAIQVWTVNSDGSNARAVTQFEEADGRAQWPAWSSDGTRMAIQVDLPNREHPELSTSCIWVIDLTTGGAQRLAPHAQAYLDETPSWFPDGKRIAFQSNRSGRMEVWVMYSDGTGARPVTR